MEDMLAILLPHLHMAIATQPQVMGKPSRPPEEVAAIMHRLRPLLAVQTAPTTEIAVNHALQQAEADDLILITGSIYLIGKHAMYGTLSIR